MQSPLVQRIHVSPDALTRSSGRLAKRFDTVIDALSMTRALLRPLPEALVKRWLAEPRGHIIIDAQKHEFVAGESQFRGRTLRDVAWVRLALLADEPAAYLIPAGWLITLIIGWDRVSAGNDQRWRDFEGGVRSGFGAGYGGSDAARSHVNAYLAEGIARYLADPRDLNVSDPRLHKLLRATVFSQTFWETGE